MDTNLLCTLTYWSCLITLDAPPAIVFDGFSHFDFNTGIGNSGLILFDVT